MEGMWGGFKDMLSLLNPKEAYKRGRQRLEGLNEDFDNAERQATKRQELIFKMTNMFDEVKIKEKNIFFDLKKQFSAILKNFESKELFLEPIDFTAIEYEAMVHSQEKYVISESRVIHKCCESDVIIPARYGNRINYEKKLKEFKVIAIKRARKDRDKVER